MVEAYIEEKPPIAVLGRSPCSIFPPRNEQPTYTGSEGSEESEESKSIGLSTLTTPLSHMSNFLIFPLRALIIRSDSGELSII